MQNKNTMKTQNTFINTIVAFILITLPLTAISQNWRYTLKSTKGCTLYIPATQQSKISLRVIDEPSDAICKDGFASGGWLFGLQGNSASKGMVSWVEARYFERGYPVSMGLTFVNFEMQANVINKDGTDGGGFSVDGSNPALLKQETGPNKGVSKAVHDVANKSGASHAVRGFMLNTALKWNNDPYGAFTHMMRSPTTPFIEAAYFNPNAKPEADDPKVIGGSSKGVYN
jgi:hypothetical protein